MQKITPTELIYLLIACALLLTLARLGSLIFNRLKQPPVIGEILGGLLLGPTVLKQLMPDAYLTIFNNGSNSELVIDAIQNVGLIALMFCSGASLNLQGIKGDTKVIIAATISGLALPFAAGLGLAPFFTIERFMGEADSTLAFGLVCAIAFAVTSVPVISRIMRDLGILNSRLARVVISSAVIEDIALYVLLSAAVAMVSLSASGGKGGSIEQAILALPPWAAISIKTAIAVSFALAVLCILPRLLNAKWNKPWKAFANSSPATAIIVMAILIIVSGLLIGLPSMLGALIAGAALRNESTSFNSTLHDGISKVAYATVIPIYFATVGLRLDLATKFDLIASTILISVAMAIKFVSVFAGARISGEKNRFSSQLAVAMNARGGPGIVLATVAFDAGIISEYFFSTLIMLAIISSLIAANWLRSSLQKSQIE